MASFTTSTEMSERTVVRIPTPSNGAELEVALVHAVNLVKEITSRTPYDDSITVESDDEEVRLIITTKDWHVFPKR